MGVTFLQHRIAMGSFATSNLKKGRKSMPMNMTTTKNDIVRIVYGIILVIYMYIICLLLAGATNSACDVSRPMLHRSYNIGDTLLNDLNSMLNSGVIIIITILYHRRHNELCTWLKRKSCPSIWNPGVNLGSRIKMLIDFISLWTTLLNLILIVLSNPSIINPGPPKDISVIQGHEFSAVSAVSHILAISAQNRTFCQIPRNSAHKRIFFIKFA